MDGEIIRGAAEASGEGHVTTGPIRVVVGTITTPTKPETTSMGLGIEKTFEIRESEPIGGGVREYELRIDDELVWTGIGDDRADALLQAIMKATGQADEPPDN